MARHINADELTLKQRLFCQHYLKNGYNATQAAKSAGYSENSAQEIGNENLRKPLVKIYIEQSMKETFDKLGMDIEYVASKLKQGLELSIPEIKEDDDKEIKELKYEMSDVRAGVACISEYNKMCGNYAAEKKEITANVEVSKPQELLKEYEKEA